MLFSDRLWVLKALLAAGALAWLGHDARQAYSSLYPDIERVAVDWKGIRDREIHRWADRVQAVLPGGFVIQTDVGPMTIHAPSSPPVGEYVSIVARPTGPRTLEALSLQVNRGYQWKRPLNYGLSLVTVIVYLWLVRRRFRWSLPDGVFRSRY